MVVNKAPYKVCIKAIKTCQVAILLELNFPPTNRMVATNNYIVNSINNNTNAKCARMNLKNMNEISIHVTVNIRSAMLAMIYKSKKKKENVLIVSCTIKSIGLKNINKHAYNLLKRP